MPDRQLLHLVIGGELKDVADVEFKDLTKVDLVGAYASYDDAFRAWQAKAHSTVDNALMRYVIVHAHKLLEPHEDDDHGH